MYRYRWYRQWGFGKGGIEKQYRYRWYKAALKWYGFQDARFWFNRRGKNVVQNSRFKRRYEREEDKNEVRVQVRRQERIKEQESSGGRKEQKDGTENQTLDNRAKRWTVKQTLNNRTGVVRR